ncbi:hypothetical protein HKX48_002097, partial [Thoreauomyces humboldtii]
YAFIPGAAAGKEHTFNRITHNRFYVPGKKQAGDVFARAATLDSGFQINPAQYQSKVAKDAVTAFRALQQEKANSAYFDSLDSNNLFPRRNRPVAVSGSVQSQTNADGSTTFFHQPAWIRMQQNQMLGDTVAVERTSGANLQDGANGPTQATILAHQNVMNKTDSSEFLSKETGKLAESPSVLLNGSNSGFPEVPSHRVRDLRTVETNTTSSELDPLTLELIFGHPGKFQTFLDQLKFGNTTLQAQLKSQEQQLGNMTATTMKTFKDILVKSGFSADRLPNTISPDDILYILERVDSLTPVGLSEVTAMRQLITTLQAQRVAELKDVDTQTFLSPTSPERPKKIPPRVNTSAADWVNAKTYQDELYSNVWDPTLPDFEDSPKSNVSISPTISSGKSSPERAASVPVDEFIPERVKIRVDTSQYSTRSVDPFAGQSRGDENIFNNLYSTPSPSVSPPHKSRKGKERAHVSPIKEEGPKPKEKKNPFADAVKGSGQKSAFGRGGGKR